MSRPRILFVENGLGRGGATRCLIDLLTHAPRRGYDPVVAIAYEEPALRDLLDPRNIIDISRFRRRGLTARPPAPATGMSALGRRLRGRAAFVLNTVSRDLPLTRCLAREIRARRIDLVHTNNGLLVNRAEIHAARHTCCPMIAHQRCLEWPAALTRRLSLAVDRILAISRTVRTSLLAAAAPEADIRLVYDGVDVSHVSDAPARRSAARRQFGLHPDDFVIAFPAAHLAWKGHDVLLRATRLLAPRYPRLTLLIAGAAPAGAPSMRPTVASLARELGVAAHARILDHRPDTSHLYAAADLLVHASVEPEPLGLVILEAMAAGLPVVASEAGGPAETVLHGTTGLLYPPGDATALADCIAGLIENPAQRDALGAAGAARAAAHFDLHRARDAVFDHVDCVLAARNFFTEQRIAWRFAPSCS